MRRRAVGRAVDVDGGAGGSRGLGVAGTRAHRPLDLRVMKARTLAIIASGAGILAVAFAIHFELDARSHIYSELRGVRAQAAADLAHHRISASRAAALESELGRARRRLKADDVRGAQKLLDRVKADLKSRPRSA
jgi:hypothetical protein